MKNKKKSLSLILALVLIITSLGTFGIEASAASHEDIRNVILSRLYGGASGGYMSCDYDGYTTTAGRHEGIDFRMHDGAPIYAVLDGTVTGKGTSDTGVTVLAVYNSTYDVTIVYEHGSFSVNNGDPIVCGAKLGTESNNGAPQGGHTHFELRTGKRTGGASNRNDTLENPNPYPYYERILFGEEPVKHTADTRYPTTITAVPIAKSGNIAVYDASGNTEANRYISAGDVCRILAVYTDGWVLAEYPSGSGRRSAYVKKNVFFASDSILGTLSPKINVPMYRYSDFSGGSWGSAFSSDVCTVVGSSGNNRQVICPIPGGYRLGWIDSTASPIVPQKEESYTPVSQPLSSRLYGFLAGKSIVTMAPAKIAFSGTSYISEGDVCILSSVSESAGSATATYPSGGNDVFTNYKSKKNASVSLGCFIAYDANFEYQKLKATGTVTVYPTSAMQKTVNGKTTNWSLDPGDEYYTVGRASNGASEVLYYCSRGTHAGYWKLGFVWLDYVYFDVNGCINGADSGDLGNCGTVDVTVNGEKVAEDVNDFYRQYPVGSSYTVSDIKAKNGYSYAGVKSGALSGTIGNGANVRLSFTKNAPTLSLSSIAVSKAPDKATYLEGESLNTAGLAVTAYYSDGSSKDVTTACSISGCDSTPGVKTVTVTYSGKICSFTVDIVPKAPAALTIASKPSKTSYTVGDNVSASGLSVSVSYNNGTKRALEADEYELVFDDDLTASAGMKTVTVSYTENGKTVYADFTIDVAEPIHEPEPIIEKVLKLDVVPEKDHVSVGDKVKVDLILSENPGVTSLKLMTSFDSNVLVLDDITYNTAIGGLSQMPQTFVSPVTLNWIDGLKDNTFNGTFASLTFTARAACDLTSVSVIGSSEDIFDMAENPVTLTANDASLSITPKAAEPEEETALPVIKLSAPTLTARPGEEIVMKLELKNNDKGFSGIEFDLQYDKTELTPVSVSADGFTFTKPEMADGKIIFTCGGIENITSHGVLGEIVFKVSDNAEEGTVPLVLTAHKGSQYYYEGADELNYTLDTSDGAVMIRHTLPGDANGDGVVSNRDASRILQYLAGWDTAIDEAGADANGDGVISNRDASRILQYLADWEVTLG